MSPAPILVRRSGLVTSVGTTAASAAAGIRAKLANPFETSFRIDGEWLMAHQVPSDEPATGRARLCDIAVAAIDQAMADIPKSRWQDVPLLLCVAEPERPGRTEGLDDRLFGEIQTAAGGRFQQQSAIVPQGRVGALVALARARELVASKTVEQVLIVGVDSYLSWPTLSHYERQGRLLTSANANGFMPGEAAAALLVGAANDQPGLACIGIGTGHEPAHINSGEPLRAEGLERSIKAALTEAGLAMHDVDYRIADLSGEQYYFKEASISLSRTMRQRKAWLDIWQPAECVGETGAAIGVIAVSLADIAARKGFAAGRTVIVHMGNDSGPRACGVFRWSGAH